MRADNTLTSHYTSHTYSHTHSHTHKLTHSPTHSLTTHSLTHSFTHTINQSHKLTHSLTHILIHTHHPLTPTHTHPHTHSHPHTPTLSGSIFLVNSVLQNTRASSKDIPSQHISGQSSGRPDPAEPTNALEEEPILQPAKVFQMVLRSQSLVEVTHARWE